MPNDYDHQPREFPKTGIQQYAGTGVTRHCFACDKHRAVRAGGSVNPRTRLWTCASCVEARGQLLKEAA